MDALDRDDFVHALTQTLKFYGKELDKMQTSFWVTACRDRPAKKLKAALVEHTKAGRFAPKPADILSLVDNMSQQGGRAELPPPPTTNCPPEIANAWIWFNKLICSTAKNELMRQKADVLDEETEERYLHIVNHEAHKYGIPDAIPEEYKLSEVWG